jgi:tight adherence protein B
MTMLAIVIAGFLGGAILLLFLGVARLIRGTETIEERLSAMAGADEVPALPTEVEATGKRKRGLSRLVESLVAGRSFTASLATELARANIPLTASEYVVFQLLCALVVGLLVWLFTRQLWLALVGGAAGLLLPRIWVSRKQAQRLAAFQDQLPDVLSLLVGSLRAGYGLTVAMDTVARLLPAPSSEEFSRVVREVGLGMSVSRALANMVRRIRSDDLDLAVTAISIQSETGGNLAAILDSVSTTIRERVRMKGQLRTLMSQANMQRYVLTALPGVLALILYVLNPTYMLALFTPGLTLLIPITAVLLVIMGSVVMGKLSTVEM